MITDNDSDHEAIAKVVLELKVHEFLIAPEDIKAILIRFEKLLYDYESSKADFISCPHCREYIK